MESDESRPASSASTSSESSDNSDNSRPSSPIRHGNPKSPPPIVDEQSRSRPSSRSVSRSSNPRSVSKSGSHSRSSSSSSDNDEEDNAKLLRTKRSSRSSSEESHNKLRQGVVSRNQSISPVRKSRSKRNSSVSSNQSRSNDIDFNEDGILKENALNMSHEDLSDVSDMECEKREQIKETIEDEGTNLSEPANKVVEDEDEDEDDLSIDGKNEDALITDLRQKLDKKKNLLKSIESKEKTDALNGKGTNNVEIDDELTKNHDEDALDFEAEDGECTELSKEDEPIENDVKKDNSEGLEEGEELEEGEVSDEEDKRPEENEPKPVCRFYTRGQCTWGMSCRFLHPGVTDKGNYTMFDMVRPVPVPHGGRPLPVGFERPDPYHDYRNERPPLIHRQPIHHHLAAAAAFRGVDHEPRSIPAAAVVDAPVVETAWERGLRTAKEMMRKANKRKEQDMDFDDKKMNLKVSQDELEKDSSYYLKERITPPDAPPGPPFARHPAYHGAVEPGAYSPPDRFMRAPVPFDEIDPYGRSARYRELPSHRMPQYEDERRVRPAREVIVQRVEPPGRGDEWNDPWMRTKSPGARIDREKRRRDRSYSSNSSYSTSSSSQSDSSSESSRTPTPSHRRRYNSNSHKSPPARRHAHPHAGLRSPSPRRVGGRRSPSNRRSPIPKRRHMSPSPIDEKRAPYSPVPNKRKKISTPPLKSSIEPNKSRRRRSSSSDSGSSDSSGSESDSSGSSTSGSTSRGNTPVKRGSRRPPTKPVHRNPFKSKVEPPKKRSPISMEIKKPNTVGVSALTSPTPSNDSPPTSGSGGRKVTRREELLKQLRAVEDAIARKRTRLT